MFEKVLVPLDGSPLADQMVPRVLQLIRGRPDAEVRLLRVLGGFEFDDAVLRGADPTRDARSALERAASPLRQAGVATACDVTIGDAAAKILEFAGRDGSSVIAMASHGRSGADLWVRGSIAERVLRHARNPVYLATPRSLEDGREPKRVLVPLDGSEGAAAILPLVGEVAKAFGSEVLLVHVLEGPGTVPQPTTDPDAAAAILARGREALPGVSVRTLTPKGSAAYAILHAVDAESPDLVAMTTHGRSGPSRWVFGSVAEHVLHQCRAPLLVKRTPGASQEA